MYQYKTRGTCSRLIEYDVVDGIVKNVRFIGGCNGNLQGIAKLVEGREVNEVINLLSGINCRNGTSCPDQLANALKKHV
jgi:uncharacterized protein (TIGR03905 family)